MAAEPEAVERWRARLERELWESVVPFWLRHSLDRRHGGFLDQLDREGQRYDTHKHVWLQGRQVWTFARLHRARPDERLLVGARRGAEFLRDHAFAPDGQVYFCLTREGAPVKLQRKVFSACFVALGFAEYARASGDEAYRAAALELFDRVVAWSRDPGALGRPVLAGRPPVSDLAVPMILLHVAGELRGADGPPLAGHDGLEDELVARIRRHLDPELRVLREHVREDGARLDSPEGRLVNPGHSLEAAWFLLERARRTGDAPLAADALAVMEGALALGWDPEHGGLLYFVDAEGRSPVQLEWSMKLWWPHCEAVVALLMAWRATGDPAWFARFERVAEWTLARFPDPEHGEWFGYLDRAGRVTHDFKGGPYKGCYHVPRALFLAERLLAARGAPRVA